MARSLMIASGGYNHSQRHLHLDGWKSLDGQAGGVWMAVGGMGGGHRGRGTNYWQLGHGYIRTDPYIRLNQTTPTSGLVHGRQPHPATKTVSQPAAHAMLHAAHAAYAFSNNVIGEELLGSG